MLNSFGFSLLVMSFPDTNFCLEMEKFRGFDQLIFRHSGSKQPKIEERVFTRQEMLNSNKKQPTNQKSQMEFLNKPSQDLLKVLISVHIDIHRLSLLSKKNKMKTFPCFVPRLPVLYFFPCFLGPTLQGQFVPPLG